MTLRITFWKLRSLHSERLVSKQHLFESIPNTHVLLWEYRFNKTMFNIQNDHGLIECCLIRALQLHYFLQFDNNYSSLLLWRNVSLTNCYQWQNVPLTKCYSDELLYDENVFDEMLPWQNVIWRKCTWRNVTDPFFSCPTERNIFYKRFISIKPLWLEIIEKKGAQSQSVLYV